MGLKKGFPIAEYLGRAVTVYRDNVLLLLNFSCAASLPVMLRLLLQVSDDPGLASLGMLLGPVVFCVYVFFFLCLLFIVASLMRQDMISGKGAMAYVWTKFARGLGAYLVFSVAVIGGLILLIIPGIYCITVFMFFPFAILLEDKGLWAAFKRSDDLVKGRFWDVCWANGVMFLVSLGMFIPLLVGMKMMGLGDAVMSVVFGIAGALMAPAFLVFYYLVYEALRDEKDGTLSIAVRPA